MARKKIEANAEESRFDVQIGFIKNWDYSTTASSDQMNGHPMIGRVYRLIKEPLGYRLHIGRDKNKIGIDGLFLGPKLKAERPDFAFDIEVVTTENYLHLPLSSEDAQQVLHWITTENNDLWEKLRKEESGEAIAAIGKLPNILNLIENQAASKTLDDCKEKAAQTAMELMLQFKNKSPQDLLVLFDGIYERLLKIQIN